jgi:hypothetical protein
VITLLWRTIRRAVSAAVGTVRIGDGPKQTPKLSLGRDFADVKIGGEVSFLMVEGVENC